MNDLSFLNSDTILIFVLVAAFVGVIVALTIGARRSKKTEEDAAELNAETAEALGEDPDADPDESWTPPEPEAYPARVVDMRVVIGNVGGNKRPKTGTSFLVTFLTDDGERTEYPVPEELYVTLDVDQTGTLVILNGGFFDFGAGDAYDEGAVEEFEETFGKAEENAAETAEE